jgi:tetratricopeptide (TPR) repeat protein
MSRVEKILEMIANGGKDSFLQHALGLEYIKMGKDEEALVQFKELLEREPQYVGTYFHLGKLYEKLARVDEAIITYDCGMEEAKKANDKHSYNELMMAKEELVD